MEPAWKHKQRVVRLLEQALSPGSKVDHDVELPEIGTGTKRQCDAVIYTPRTPTHTIVGIVEVQDREKPADIATYDGWIAKMAKVGAQYLVCVSGAGFSESVVRDAATRGPMVTLLTLKELEEGSCPLYLTQTNLPVYVQDLKAASFAIHGYGESSKRRPLSASEVSFVIGGREFPVKEFVDKSFQTAAQGLRLGSHAVSVELNAPARGDLVAIYDGKRRPVRKIRVDMTVDVALVELPLQFSAYEQVATGTTLAWVGIAHGRLCEHDVEVKVVFQPNDDGLLRLAAVQAEGLPPGRRVRFTKEPAT
jgi:hypothetical protein